MNTFSSYNTQQMFPQPNGYLYVISSSLEVANVPSSTGISGAFCPTENLLYLKTLQNGAPSFLAYKVTPYTTEATTQQSTIETRLTAVENKINSLLGGKVNDKSISNEQQSSTEWN